MEDRKADAVAHLAVARSQNTGPAFWVTTKDKGGRLVRPLFHYWTELLRKLRYAGADHEKEIKDHRKYT